MEAGLLDTRRRRAEQARRIDAVHVHGHHPDPCPLDGDLLDDDPALLRPQHRHIVRTAQRGHRRRPCAAVRRCLQTTGRPGRLLLGREDQYVLCGGRPVPRAVLVGAPQDDGGSGVTDRLRQAGRRRPGRGLRRGRSGRRSVENRGLPRQVPVTVDAFSAGQLLDGKEQLAVSVIRHRRTVGYGGAGQGNLRRNPVLLHRRTHPVPGVPRHDTPHSPQPHCRHRTRDAQCRPPSPPAATGRPADRLRRDRRLHRRRHLAAQALEELLQPRRGDARLPGLPQPGPRSLTHA